ncbi:MAG TPA: Rv1535 domain-containing protein [Mycobacterium sp.]
MSKRSGGVSADPLTDVAARLLAVPLCELYAVLWRAGVVEIVDRSTADASRR